MKIQKVILYLLMTILVAWGLMLILASASPSGHVNWLFSGLVYLAIGFALFLYIRKSSPNRTVPPGLDGKASTQTDSPRTKKNLVTLLLAGLPAGGLCGAIAGGLLLYFLAKSPEPGWIKLPSPTERATNILTVTIDDAGANVLVRTEWERVFTCSSTKTECSPVELTEDQVANLALSDPCNSRPAQPEIFPSPPGTVVDTCRFFYVESFATAILLEDSTLWWYPPVTRIPLAFLAGLAGALLGGMVGLVIGLVWALRKKAHTS